MDTALFIVGTLALLTLGVEWLEWLRRRAYCSNQIGLSTMRYWRLYQEAQRE